MTISSIRTRSSGHSLAAGVLGFAFGGFFDEILLHQILQWHHFLSLVQGEAYRDLRVQILADGLFHVAVYIVASIGLVLLWRRGQDRPADRILLGCAVLGFSVWQFVDVGLVHWVIGIHRVRVGVPNPLLWDIGWLAAFGLTTLLLGLYILRNAGGPGVRSTRLTVAAISAIVILSGVAAYPGNSGSSVPVLFSPTMSAQQTFAAASSLSADIIWSDPSGQLLVLELPAGSSSWRLYREGAMLVGNTSVAGCLAFLRT